MSGPNIGIAISIILIIIYFHLFYYHLHTFWKQIWVKYLACVTSGHIYWTVHLELSKLTVNHPPR